MSCAIAVMAKAPQAGRCKTRLVPPLTPEQAAGLSRVFLRDITENVFAAAAAHPIVPYVAFSPAGSEGLFDGILAAGTRLLLADGTGEMPPEVQGFGRALLHAVRSLFDAGFAAACVLNSDSPTMPTAMLRDAADILAAPGDRVVMGPAEDGGYTLLGVKAPHAHLFADIAWSTDQVANQTRARAREAGLEMVELPVWYDVDDLESLMRLRGDLTSSGAVYPARHTALFLRQLDMDLPRRAAS